MKWGQYFTSAVGKKLIMAFTGIFLVLFLIVHCSANLAIFVPDHGETFNKVSHFLGKNWVVHILEIGLFLGFILHIVQGLILTKNNKNKRPVKYAVYHPNGQSKWYSRSMGLLGVIVLLFLIIHLAHFWVHTRLGIIFGGLSEITYNGKPVDNLYLQMKDIFSNVVVVVIYLIALVALSYHLMHGFSSAFRTLGMSSAKYIPIVQGVGKAFAIVVPLLFAIMPVAMYFGWVS